MYSTLVQLFATIAAIALCVGGASSSALPYLRVARDGDYPVFPDQPPSCPLCAQNYGSIDSCAQAAPVIANVSMVCGLLCCGDIAEQCLVGVVQPWGVHRRSQVRLH